MTRGSGQRLLELMRQGRQSSGATLLYSPLKLSFHLDQLSVWQCETVMKDARLEHKLIYPQGFMGIS